MNIEMLEALADQGDVEAMLKLTDYYLDNDRLDKSLQWADLAAAEKKPLGLYKAMVLHGALMDEMQDQRQWKKLYMHACDTSSYAASFLGMIREGAIEVEEETRLISLDLFRDAQYYTALSSYLTENSNLRYAAAHVEGSEHLRERMLWLLILFELRDSRWNFADALACLDDKEYAAAEKTSSEEIIYALAAMNAATHHTTQGSPDKAAALLDRTIAILSAPDALAALRQERAHYRKRLFGGWRYKG